MMEARQLWFAFDPLALGLDYLKIIDNVKNLLPDEQTGPVQSVFFHRQQLHIRPPSLISSLEFTRGLSDCKTREEQRRTTAALCEQTAATCSLIALSAMF